MPKSLLDKSVCRVCGKPYKADEFIKGGYTLCYECNRIECRRRYDPEKQYFTKIKLRYGITKEEFLSLLEKQGGKCAVCQRSEDVQNRRFSVDHDHKTGVVRGILCGSCNVLLGHARDDIEILDKAAAYLRATCLRKKN